MCYWGKDRQLQQGKTNKQKNTHKIPKQAHTYTGITFYNATNEIQWRKENLLNKLF